MVLLEFLFSIYMLSAYSFHLLYFYSPQYDIFVRKFFVIWNNICSNLFIFIVLNNISVYLKMMISLDFNCWHLQDETKCIGYGQPVK